MGPTTSDVVVDDDFHGLYLVARGLGPEPARTRAVQAAVAAAVSLLHRSIALDPRAPLDVLARLAVEDANAAVWRQREPESADVRVVLTLLLVRNGHVAVGHVGHGRVLRVVGGVAVPLTIEHTVAGDHGRLGYPVPEAVEELPHALTRQLGDRMFIDVDVHGHALAPDSTYVLLSAGFDEVDFGAEFGRVASSPDRPRLPAQLIELARSSGQHERLSALVVHATPRAAKPEPEPEPASPPRPSLQRRLWSSLQRGVSRGLMRST